MTNKAGGLCNAVQHGDQTVCKLCRLTWDTNDPAPPECGRYPVYPTPKLHDGCKAQRQGDIMVCITCGDVQWGVNEETPSLCVAGARQRERDKWIAGHSAERRNGAERRVAFVDGAPLRRLLSRRSGDAQAAGYRMLERTNLGAEHVAHTASGSSVGSSNATSGVDEAAAAITDTRPLADVKTRLIASEVVAANVVHVDRGGDRREAINHPQHYGGDTVYEAIKVIEAWQLGFCLGNTVKYISRAGKKDPGALLEDLKKAAWYLEREIKALTPNNMPKRETRTFQLRVQHWMLKCLGAAISQNVAIRCYRFLEESLELVQACGVTKSDALELVDYTYNRPLGEPHQEVGGVVITLHALALALNIDADHCGEIELERVWEKIDAIRAKQASKKGTSPLLETGA